MRFAQFTVAALAPLAFAQDILTETVVTDVLPTPEAPSAPEVPSEAPIPTTTGEEAAPIESLTSAFDSLTSAAASVSEALSEAISESIAASESAQTDLINSLSRAYETETDTAVLSSLSTALAGATSALGDDDDSPAARPTGAIAAGALFGGAAILAAL